MPERVELSTRRRLAAEPGLRQQPVDDDHDAVGERQPVGPEQPRDGAHGGERRDERDQQQHVLPRRGDGERRVAHSRLPEERHRQVVEREPHDEDEQRDPGQAIAHVVATSVMPRFEMRTGTGKSARSSAVPSRWFSFAQGFPARS